MEYFVDTNIPIAYIFFTDPWHDDSVKFFDYNDKIHYSKTVHDEFEKKYFQIHMEQSQFFDLLDENIRYSNKKFFSKKEVINLAKNLNLRYDFSTNKKISCINSLWNYFNLNDNINTRNLIICIDKLIRDFDRILFERKREFEFKALYAPKRIKNYSNLLNILLKNNIHFPDTEIVLDAHDLSLNENIVLNFISSDNKLCKYAKHINELKINKFIYLKSMFK